MIHGWSAFGGADHGWQDVGLERRAWTLSQAVSGSVGSQGAATNVSTLRVGADRSWRSQEHSADGGAAWVWRIWPVAGRGRPRQRHVPNILSLAAGEVRADARWRNITWRTGTKGKLKARFAAVRVRVADGPPQRIRDKGQQHLPGDEAWLIGEPRMSGERKYYLANLPAKTDLRTLAATIKARWICEQAHQQMKEELGLDHFEGRSWQGLHRHALMTMIAYAFLQHTVSQQRRGKKRIDGPPPQPTLPAVRHAILELFARLPPQRCPHCQKWICSEQRRE